MPSTTSDIFYYSLYSIYTKRNFDQLNVFMKFHFLIQILLAYPSFQQVLSQI